MRLYYFGGSSHSAWILYILILVGGYFWCREIIRRLPEDINTFKHSADRTEKWVTIVYWIITAVIMALMAYSAWALAVKIIDFVR